MGISCESIILLIQTFGVHTLYVSLDSTYSIELCKPGTHSVCSARITKDVCEGTLARISALGVWPYLPSLICFYYSSLGELCMHNTSCNIENVFSATVKICG